MKSRPFVEANTDLCRIGRPLNSSDLASAIFRQRTAKNQVFLQRGGLTHSVSFGATFWGSGRATMEPNCAATK